MEQALTFESRDEFNRKPIAEKISKLLQSDIDVSPMVIDGGWGTGKSEFCQKLIALMNEQAPNQYHLVYVDAFRTDHTGEPLLALLAEIIKTCVPVDDTDESKQKRQKIIATMAKGAKFAVKTGAKALLAHVLKQDIEQLSDEWEEIVDDKAKELGEKAIDSVVDKGFEKATAALLQEQIEAEQNLVTLQANLRELAQEKPIILFIDELDRCRPDYAIDMLEIVKHVFNIENVKIVLITNLAQLRAAVNHRYGDIVDSHKYLDKFIKFRFQLPIRFERNFEESNHASYKYLYQLIQSNPNLSKLNIFAGYGGSFFIYLINLHHISLRDIEKIVMNFEILQLIGEGYKMSNFIEIHKCLYIFSIVLYSIKPELLFSLATNQGDAKEISKFLNVDSNKILSFSDNDYPELEEVIMVISNLYCHKEQDLFFPKRRGMWLEKSRQVVYRYNSMLDDSVYYLYEDFFEDKRLQHQRNIFAKIFDTLSLSSVVV